MTRIGYVLVTLCVAELFAALFVGVAIIAPRPRLIWNASASAPIGLYQIAAVDQPKVDDLVAIMPPASLAGFMADRRYLAAGVPLLKHVAALPGTRVCRQNDRVTIAGQLVAIALRRDSHGRPLAVWRGCHVVAESTLFLLNAAAESFDSRYFGAIPASGLIGRAAPIFTRDAPGRPLRWRGRGASTAPLQPPKEKPRANRQLPPRR